MSEVWTTLIAVAGVVIVALGAFRVMNRGLLEVCHRMDSLERRMAVIEAYMRPRQPASPLPSPECPEVTETPQLRALQETLRTLDRTGYGAPPKYFDPLPAPRVRDRDKTA